MNLTPSQLEKLSECNRCPFNEKQLLAQIVYLLNNGAGSGGGGGVTSIVAGNGVAVSGSGAVTVGVIPQVYRALLTQSGTSAPVATVLEDSIGLGAGWAYSTTGIYTITIPGNPGVALVSSQLNVGSKLSSNYGLFGTSFALQIGPNTVLGIETYNNSTGANVFQDNILLNSEIEILVYP